MTNMTTTSGLIGTLAGIQSKKLQYQELIMELTKEIEESETTRRLMKGKALIAELEQEEIEIRKQGLDILEKAGLDKFEANGIEVRKKTSAGRLVIDDEAIIPDEYKKEEVKTTIKIDKKEIKSNMKEGEIIDGVHLEQDISLEVKYK